MSNIEYEYLFTITKGTGSTGENGKELQTELKSYANRGNNELIELPFIASRKGTGNDYPTIRFEYENISTGAKKITREYTQNSDYKYFKIAIYTTGSQIKARFFIYDKDYNEIPLSSSNKDKTLVNSANFQTHRFRVISYHGDYSATDNYAIILPPEPESVFYKMPTKRQTIKSVEYKAKTRYVKRVFKTYTIPTERQIKKNIQVSTSCNTRRQINTQCVIDVNTKRKAISSISAKVNTSRLIKYIHKSLANTKRQIVKMAGGRADVYRKVIKQCGYSAETIRKVAGAISVSKAHTKRSVLKHCEYSANTKRISVVSSISKAKTTRQIKMAVLNISCNVKAYRKVIHDTSSAVGTMLKTIKTAISSIPAIREIEKDNFFVEYSIKTKRIVIKMLSAKSTVMGVRVVKEYERRGAIKLLQSNTVKNEKGQSNIVYECIGDIKGNTYPVKANVESLPIGLSDKTKYLLITKDKKITSAHYVEIDDVIYGIDMLTRYSMHKEVYLKEL